MTDGTNRQGGSSNVNRRTYLKSSTAALATGFVAGCTGGGNQEFDGVSFEIWCANGRHSSTAAQWFEDTAAEFGEETGANVSVNIPPSPFGSPQQWLSTFRAGDYPVLFEEGHYVMGHILREQWVHPLDDWIDQVDQDLWSNYEWLMPSLEEAHRGSPVRSWGLPYDFLTYTPIAARRDFMEEAGVSVEDEWPPETWDDMVGLAETIQNNSSANYGIGIHGDPGDSLDSGANIFALGDGGKEEGTILNQDWSATNFDNDVWRDVMARYIGIFRDKGLSSPRTPTHSDEDGVTGVITGNLGMSMIEVLNMPVILDQGRQLVEDGTITWGEPPSQNNTYYNSPGMWCLTKAPDGVDEDEWEQKQEAAIQLVNKFLDEGTQQRVFENIGYLPGHEGVAEDLSSEYRDDHLYNVAYRMMQNSDVAFSVAEATPNIMFVECSPVIQEGLKGDLTPDEVCTRMAEIGNELLSD